MNPLLLRNVRPYGDAPLDVRIENGVIAQVGSLRPTAADEVVDGKGAVLLPGLVDLHTHLREPGREDAETVQTGSTAAALGGYTAVFAMPNTEPCADTAGVVEQVWRLGRQTGLVDVQPIGAVTAGRLAWPTPRSCAARWSTCERSMGSSRSTPRIPG
jgi:dihydroorotase